MQLRSLVPISIGLLFASSAQAYPGGTPDYQTDAAPFCASCHASRSEGALAGSPGDRAVKELAANKHVALVRAGAPNTGYATMTEADRQTLATQIEQIDRASTVTLDVPATVKAGETVTVTVSTTGGAGVVGIALVDGDHRWQARPIAAAGWQVVGAPQVMGSDGKAQTEWLAKRPESSGRNLSYVNVTGVSSNVVDAKWGAAKAVFTLRAPSGKGPHPLAAVYFYGTEKASPLGYTIDPKDPLGRKQIRGGFTGGSGRVLFSQVARITIE